MKKNRIDAPPRREHEAVCFGSITSPHYSVYRRELARKGRSRARRAVTVVLAVASAAVFSAAVGSLVYLLRDSAVIGGFTGTVIGIGGESESSEDVIGELLLRAQETAKQERTDASEVQTDGTVEQKLESFTGIDFIQVSPAWSKIYSIPRGLAVQRISGMSWVGGVQMRVGDVVTSINGISIFGMDEAYAVISGMKNRGDIRAELSFYRNGENHISVFVFQ